MTAQPNAKAGSLDTRAGKQQTGATKLLQSSADDPIDEDEILKGIPNNQRISKMSRTSPGEPADKDKQMSI
jgi:hypothetical protein